MKSFRKLATAGIVCLAAVIPAGFDWSDVGSWNAVRSLLPQDAV